MGLGLKSGLGLALGLGLGLGLGSGSGLDVEEGDLEVTQIRHEPLQVACTCEPEYLLI